MQRSMREPGDLPQVVVYDIDTGKEVHHLSGHTDAIMWTSFSLDDQYIASVSWDGTMRMYSASTAELLWVTENSGGQSWSAAFSPDTKHIVWSSSGGRVTKLHDISDGKLIFNFPEEHID